MYEMGPRTRASGARADPGNPWAQLLAHGVMYMFYREK
jgi:hypothetical protein